MDLTNGLYCTGGHYWCKCDVFLYFQVIPVLDTNAPRESRPRGADCVFSSSAGYLRPVCAERPSSPSRDWLGRMFEETPRDGSLQKWYLGR